MLELTLNRGRKNRGRQQAVYTANPCRIAVAPISRRHKQMLPQHDRRGR